MDIKNKREINKLNNENKLMFNQLETQKQLYNYLDSVNKELVIKIRLEEINLSEKGETTLVIDTLDGNEVNQVIPVGLKLIVSVNSLVQIDQPLTEDPNVGGFGQAETEITLQNPIRIVGYMIISLLMIICQIFLVLKKKQFEKVQAAELNF